MATERNDNPRATSSVERQKTSERRDQHKRRELLDLYVRVYLRHLVDDGATHPNKQELTSSEATRIATALALADRLIPNHRTIAEFAVAMTKQGYRCEWEDGRVVLLEELTGWLAS